MFLRFVIRSLSHQCVSEPSVNFELKCFDFLHYSYQSKGLYAI